MQPYLAAHLVHKAYLRMSDQQFAMQNRNHFMALASTQMRRILIDYARRHRRRGGDQGHLQLEDTMAVCGRCPADILAMGAALEKLSGMDAELVRLVEDAQFPGPLGGGNCQLMRLSLRSKARVALGPGILVAGKYHLPWRCPAC